MSDLSLPSKALLTIKGELEALEKERYSVFACPSQAGIRRVVEPRDGHRQVFAQDADRVLHSKAYARYIDKTQVFSLVTNDHITHRVLHVQFVSRIARTIGRFLGLNEDLIEAIALGHDIGHPPFGHEGERILSKICRENGLKSFQHNIQSVQFLDRFERQGKGWNLCLQVLDGILCHDGEVHSHGLVPDRDKDFTKHDQEIMEKEGDPLFPLLPMTLEGCVVRLSDTIAYIGRDIEDAIELELITREDIPKNCVRVLGETNGTIVYTLVSDVINASKNVRYAGGDASEHDAIGFSEGVAEALLQLKKFNYERIYHNPRFKPDYDKIHRCYEALFCHYSKVMEDGTKQKEQRRSFLRSISPEYLTHHSPAAVVRDYLAGMTDEYFLRKASEIGCDTPRRLCLPS